MDQPNMSDHPMFQEMSDSYNIKPGGYLSNMTLHRHQSDHNIGHRHSFSTQENDFMNTLFATNAGTPDSANVFFNDISFNFNQGDGAGPSSFPIDENIFPIRKTNTNEDQTRVERRDVPRRNRRPRWEIQVANNG
ncbi:unnamed protein product [Lupinus luteus]|uniref:Uncharacterized protein n=1 Tax=Lupinus luteus TaxID=3873 RepID=A0AAV1YFV0_LUPLU